ncbi:MAG: hypothetical protein IM638_19760 [Bacteroidetes bacterium]|nr:hypothetical protein [Bacteroidota bacterium]
MKTLSLFGILFSLICLGCSIFMMNAECNCPPSESASLYFNDTEPSGTFGAGLISLLVSLFFLTFSIISSVIFFGQKNERSATPVANWQPSAMQQPPQPQPNYNWQTGGYPPPAPNQQWIPPQPPQQQAPPPAPQWTPPPASNQQWTPPQPGWQQPPAGDDINRWAPRQDNTPPAN